MKYYCSNWKEAFQNAWLYGGFPKGFIILEMTFPVSVFNEVSVLLLVSYYILLLPLMAAAMHCFMYPNRLEKTMFLCPMGKREKRDFLEVAYRFRIVCTVGGSIVIIVLLLAAGLLQKTVYLAGFFISEIMFASIVFLENDAIRWEVESALKLNGYTFWSYVSWFASMIACLVFAFTAIETSHQVVYKNGEHIIFLVIFLIQLFLWMKLMISYRNRVMEVGEDYEKSYLAERKGRNDKNL